MHSRLDLRNTVTTCLGNRDGINLQTRSEKLGALGTVLISSAFRRERLRLPRLGDEKEWKHDGTLGTCLEDFSPAVGDAIVVRCLAAFERDITTTCALPHKVSNRRYYPEEAFGRPPSFLRVGCNDVGTVYPL
jgi:hypothetical protein